MTTRRAAMAIALGIGAIALGPGASRARADAGSFVAGKLAERVHVATLGLDFDVAHRELAAAEDVVDDPQIALEAARLALYELDCDGAAATLARPEVERIDDGEMLADIARGCRRVIAALAVTKDDARGIEVRWQDEHDSALAPVVYDTVARARDALTRDLGVDWPRPTRIVVVSDLLSLSAMTGLPYDSARTTGTVAVAKWGRVTLLSPRASAHGFPWRDTLAHELTHLAVTHATLDAAPLWLQEGVAKREEVRWRDPGPFDDRPSPDAVAARGFERGLGIPLDKLGPSIAMLPSADAAMVAFAEVTSFVRFYVDTQGDRALPSLFQEIRNGKDASAALVAASGADLKEWNTRWRASLAAHPQPPLSPLLGLGGPKASDAEGKNKESKEAKALRDVRERLRLAELLLGRGKAQAALQELDRIGPAAPASGPPLAEQFADAGDPGAVWLRGRASELAGRGPDMAPLVADPRRVVAPYGPWWALRSRWQAATGDLAGASDALLQAMAQDPLDADAVCPTNPPGPDASKLTSWPIVRPLCDAAIVRAVPSFGGD